MVRSLLALLIALAFLFAQSGCKSPAVAAKKAPWDPQVHHWVFAPMVKVCASAPVTDGEVQWALDQWAQNGAPQLTAIPSNCFVKDEPFTVYVDRPTVQEYLYHWDGSMTVGLTSVFFYAEGQPPVGAYLNLISDDRRVLLHEVGHLWIPEHYPGKGHVMAEWLHDFDYDFKGTARVLRKAD